MKTRLAACFICVFLFLTACTRTPSDDTTSTTKESAIESSQAAIEGSAAVKAVVEGADKSSVFALITPSSGALYEDFQEEDARKMGYKYDDMAMLESVYILTLAESVDFTLEKVEYNPNFSYFEKDSDLVKFGAKRGDLFVLNVSLPEGAPNMRLVAAESGYMRLAAWPCAYIGTGDAGAIYISPNKAFDDMGTDSPIAQLSIAAVTAAAIERNTPEPAETVRPEDLMWTANKYWYTLAHALTLMVDGIKGSYNWQNTQIPCHIVHDCGLAIFPELTHPELDDTYFTWPDSDPNSGRNYGSELCRMLPYDYGNTISFEVHAVQARGDGTAYVDLTIDSDRVLEKPLKYRVEWQENLIGDLTTPFPYHMTKIKLLNSSDT